MDIRKTPKIIYLQTCGTCELYKTDKSECKKCEFDPERTTFATERIYPSDKKYFSEEVVRQNKKTNKPVPLTYDILHDTLEGVDGCSFFWDDRLSKDSEDWYEIRIHRADVEHVQSIRYVHELQQILRVCGIKKEVVL